VKVRLNRYLLHVRGESHDTTVSIVGITLQQRRVSESTDFTDGCHGGVCIDVRRGRCSSVTIFQALPTHSLINRDSFSFTFSHYNSFSFHPTSCCRHCNYRRCCCGVAAAAMQKQQLPLLLPPLLPRALVAVVGAAA
jgi:hypothetical protein